MSGSVYFIKSNDHVKIGYSTDVNSRLSQLQTGSPSQLEILAIVPGAASLEAIFHEVLQEWHERGEWFRLDRDLGRRISLMMRNIASGRVKQVITHAHVRRALGIKKKRCCSAMAQKRMDRAEFFQRVAHKSGADI